MKTKRSTGSFVLSILVIIACIVSVVVTATNIEENDAAPGEIVVDAIISKVSSGEVEYGTHIGEDNIEVYDFLIRQTIELEYSIDNKKETEILPNLIVHQQVVDAPLKKEFEQNYAEESCYKLGEHKKLYVMENDHSRFRIAEKTGGINKGLGIALIVIEIIISAIILVLLIKHTLRVMFEFV